MPGIAAAAAVAIKAVVGGGLTAVGVGTTTAYGIGSAVGGFLTGATFLGSVAFGIVSSVLTPQVDAAGSPTDWRADTDAAIHFVAGRRGVAGTIVHRDEWGKDNRYQSIVTVFGGAGPYKSIGSTTADGESVTFSGPYGRQSTGTWNDIFWGEFSLGAQPSTALRSPSDKGDPTIGGTMPGWGSAYKLSGKAAAMFTLAMDKERKRWPSGEPKMLSVLEGMYCWDPRQDSTYPGGSGSCRLADPSTWVWSDNPLLHALKWALGYHENGVLVGGIGAAVSGIDVAAYVEGANVCDANGWVVSAYPSTKDDKHQVLLAFLQAGGCRYARKGGKISCIVRTPRTSIVDVTAADTAGPFEIEVGADMLDRLNTVVPRCAMESHDWEMVAQAPVSVGAYVTADGARRERGIDYPYVAIQPSRGNTHQPAQLAAYDIVDSREPIRGRVPLKPYMAQIQPGDVFTVDEPGFLLDGVECLCVQREFDPQQDIVQITFVSETEGKHAFALGQDPTPPEPPALTAPDIYSVAAPEVGAFIAAAGTGNQPQIVVGADADNVSAQSFIVDVRPAVDPADGEAWDDDDAGWEVFGTYPISTTRVTVTGLEPETAYQIGVRYISEFGVIGERIVLDTVTTGALVATSAAAIGDIPADRVQAAIDEADTLAETQIREALDRRDRIRDSIAEVWSTFGTAEGFLVEVEEWTNQSELFSIAAAESATAAGNSSTAAAGYRAQALTYANNAGASASAAAVSATAAAASETAAGNSATAAGGFAGDAETAATAAGDSASSASASATAAAASETAAGNSATAAGGFATDAETAATAAGDSASAASVSAGASAAASDAAGDSASAASGFAADAAASATSAGEEAAATLTLRTEAQAAASSASSSATQATTASNNAAASATAASNSATASGNSASAASSSAAAADEHRAAAAQNAIVAAQFGASAKTDVADAAEYFTSDLSGLDYEAAGFSGWTEVTSGGEPVVYSTASTISFGSRARFNPKPGRRYRVTALWRWTTGTVGSVTVGFRADPLVSGSAVNRWSTVTAGAANEWREASYEITADAAMAQESWRPVIRRTGNTGRIEVRALIWEDLSAFRAVGQDTVSVYSTAEESFAARLIQVSAGDAFAAIQLAARKADGTATSVLRMAAQLFGYGADFDNPRFFIDAVNNAVYGVADDGTTRTFELDFNDDGRLRIWKADGTLQFDSAGGGVYTAGIIENAATRMAFADQVGEFDMWGPGYGPGSSSNPLTRVFDQSVEFTDAEPGRPVSVFANWTHLINGGAFDWCNVCWELYRHGRSVSAPSAGAGTSGKVKLLSSTEEMQGATAGRVLQPGTVTSGGAAFPVNHNDMKGDQLPGTGDGDYDATGYVYLMRVRVKATALLSGTNPYENANSHSGTRTHKVTGANLLAIQLKR